MTNYNKYIDKFGEKLDEIAKDGFTDDTIGDDDAITNN